MDADTFLRRLLLTIVFSFTVFVSYNIGKQATITKVLNLIEDEEQVTKETVVLEDLRIDISKLR
jgi:hypothetical protein